MSDTYYGFSDNTETTMTDYTTGTGKGPTEVPPKKKKKNKGV